ncbi:mycothiol system anti-sigma-R factor [Actinomyces sp. W5033]|uniref:mycothiol system anti-sigma-R factor n=1 Tax=Actinomyces sp. W5033 TaxID=3446479 RepID=UPI003EE2EB13
MGQDAAQNCSCTEARAHLEAFLDHECDGDLSTRLARHVATCEHCSRLADAENHLREILRSRCAEQAPPELRERVIGRLSVMRATTVTSSTTVVSDGTTTVRSQTVRVVRSQA